MTRSRQGAVNTRRYGLANFICRGCPPTEAHAYNVREGLRVADQVLVSQGSANAPRRFDYTPFTTQEREQMFRLMLTAEENRRVHFLPVEDQDDMADWTGIIRKAANAIEPQDGKITLVGNAKDSSSFYLKHFPGWKSTNTENFGDNLSATTFRKLLFAPTFDPRTVQWPQGLHPEVQAWLGEFSHTAEYTHLVEEALKCAADVEKYGRIDPETGGKVYGPYLAADMIVIQGDHVLLIERGGHPFKGCEALPGGIVHDREDVVEAAIREGKREETGLKVSERTLRQSYVTTLHYTSPHRDPRGRMISASSIFHLNPIPPASMTDPDEISRFLALPKLKAGDDAAATYWKSKADISRRTMAFDHYIQIMRAFNIIKGN